MYAIILEQHWGVAAGDIAEKAKIFPSPFRSKQQLYAWNAEANPFDFTARHRGAKVDDEMVLLEVQCARSWGSDNQKSSSQEVILKRVRAMVDEMIAVGEVEMGK